MDAASPNLMVTASVSGAICSNVGIAVLYWAHRNLPIMSICILKNLQNSDGTFNKLFEENRNHYFALQRAA